MYAQHPRARPISVTARYERPDNTNTTAVCACMPILNADWKNWLIEYAARNSLKENCATTTKKRKKEEEEEQRVIRVRACAHVYMQKRSP